LTGTYREPISFDRHSNALAPDPSQCRKLTPIRLFSRFPFPLRAPRAGIPGQGCGTSLFVAEMSLFARCYLADIAAVIPL
jgi:hypothetical protein